MFCHSETKILKSDRYQSWEEPCRESKTGRHKWGDREEKERVERVGFGERWERKGANHRGGLRGEEERKIQLQSKRRRRERDTFRPGRRERRQCLPAFERKQDGEHLFLRKQLQYLILLSAKCKFSFPHELIKLKPTLRAEGLSLTATKNVSSEADLCPVNM